MSGPAHRCRALFVALAMGSSPPAVAAEAWGLPMADYDSDTGLGLGAMGGLSFGATRGFGTAEIELDLYGSMGGEQFHGLWIELDELAHRPLRVSLGGGYASSRWDTYCGTPGEDACATTTDETYTAFGHSSAYADLSAEWRFGPTPWSLFGGWSGAVLMAGIPRAPEPLAGSLYAERFPEGEEGLESTVQAGLAYDTRDDDEEPSRGVWADLSLRAAAPAWGSAWSYLGGNATLRTYAPLGGERFVLASRLGTDIVFGDQPTAQTGSTGGLQGYGALGGGEIGRGIRHGRYRGQVKLVGQQELRARIGTISALSQTIEVGGVGFVDAGWVAHKPTALTDAAAAWSTGVGLRLNWNDFLVRADLGLSPAEDWAPSFHVDFGHVF